MLEALDKIRMKCTDRKSYRGFIKAKCTCGTIRWFELGVFNKAKSCGCNRKHTSTVKIQESWNNKDIEERSKFNASNKKAKSNKSGYIGVSFSKYWNRWEARIISKGILVLKNNYKDLLTGKYQGVIDRELYILKHNLPHTRNLNNEELLSMMEEQSYGDINKLKE